MNEQILKEILEDANIVLNQLDIPYFLIGGTLLGAIREKDFLKWDKDVDLGIYYNGSFMKIFDALKHFEKLGFTVAKFNINNISLDRGYRLDLFWIFEQLKGKKIEYFYLKIGDSRLVYPAYCFNELETIEFLGKKYKIPRNPKRFLECTYGKDWEIPMPDFPFEKFNNIIKDKND